MLVETSVGDILDKVSILEIKRDRISDPNKHGEIRRELTALATASNYKEKFAIWYSLLKQLNLRMWDLTDELKSLTTVDETYARVASQIMDFNQRRFRVKNIVNLAETTSLKEQKSYTESSVCVAGDDLSHIVYAATVYDIVYISKPNLICTTSNFRSTDSPVPPTAIAIPAGEAHIYAFPTIRYVSGGMIGDFLHQLSVVHETYLKTGRKGDVYIADIGGPFRRGLDATFADIRDVIGAQPYIASFSIHIGEPTDVNLSSWRNHPNLYNYSWAQIFENTYKVQWGKHPWIHMRGNEIYRGITFLSVTPNRPCGDLDFKYILSKLPGTVVFLATEDKQERYFLERFRIPYIPLLRVSTFHELAHTIAGCRMFVGTLSMPLALADALGKDRIALMPDSPDREIASRTPKPYIFTMSDAYALL